MLSRCWKYIYRIEYYSRWTTLFSRNTTVQPPRHENFSFSLSFSRWKPKLTQDKTIQSWPCVVYTTYKQHQYKRFIVGTIFAVTLPALWLKMDCLGLCSNGNPEEVSTEASLNGTRNEATNTCVDAGDELVLVNGENVLEEEMKDLNSLYLRGRLYEAIVVTRAQVFILHDVVRQELFQRITSEKFSSTSLLTLSAITFLSLVGTVIHLCFHPVGGWSRWASSLFSSDSNKAFKVLAGFVGYHLLLFIISYIITTAVFLVLHSWTHKQKNRIVKQVALLLSSIEAVLNEVVMDSESFHEMCSNSQWMMSQSNNGEEQQVYRKQKRILVVLFSCTSLLREQIKKFEKYIQRESKDRNNSWAYVFFTFSSAVGSSIAASYVLWKTQLIWFNDENCLDMASFYIWSAVVTGLYAWHFSYCSSGTYRHLLNKESENDLKMLREQSEQIFTLWNQIEAAANQLLDSDIIF